MALRFLADHCVSNSTVQSLREANHEVLRLKDVLPVESPDLVVITKAQEIDAILLSLNGDFSHIVNYPPTQINEVGFREFTCFVDQDNENRTRALIPECGYDQLRRRATSRGNGPSWYSPSDTLSIWRGVQEESLRDCASATRPF